MTRIGPPLVAAVALLLLAAGAASFDAVRTDGGGLLSGGEQGPTDDAPCLRDEQNAGPGGLERTRGCAERSKQSTPGGGAGGPGHVLLPGFALDALTAGSTGGGGAPVGVVAALAATLLVALAVIYRLTANVGAPATLTDADEGGPDGGAGDDVAPSVPQAPADNDVYRAWRRLTGRYDDERRTRSPAELAAAAVDVGRDAAAVRDLTATFRAVRYGGEPADADREARARDALRRAGGDDEAMEEGDR